MRCESPRNAYKASPSTESESESEMETESGHEWGGGCGCGRALGLGSFFWLFRKWQRFGGCFRICSEAVAKLCAQISGCVLTPVCVTVCVCASLSVCVCLSLFVCVCCGQLYRRSPSLSLMKTITFELGILGRATATPFSGSLGCCNVQRVARAAES